MYNVSIRLYAVLLVAASMAGFVSCGNSKSEEQLKAEALLSDAQSMFDSNQYDKSIALIDSLSKGFKYVKTQDMVEGYYVKSSVSSGNLTKRTDVEARIDELGNIYLVSSLYGKGVKHTQLKVLCNGDEVATTNVAYDNAKNYRFKDGSTPVEMVTFDKEALCRFILENRGKNITLEFCGDRIYKMQLPANTKNTIADTYLYASRKAELKKAEDLKLYYAKKLQITRRQSRQTATNISGTNE